MEIDPVGMVQDWVVGPEQPAPPQDGDGLLQVRVWVPPEQADQFDHPPFWASDVPPPQEPSHWMVWPPRQELLLQAWPTVATQPQSELVAQVLLQEEDVFATVWQAKFPVQAE